MQKTAALAFCIAALLLAQLALGAEPVELHTLDGAPKRIDLATEPRSVVLHFWSTWCPPCVDELAVLDRVVDGRCAESVRVIAVNVAESQDLVRRFVSEHGVRTEVLMDRHGAIFRRFRGNSLPANYVQATSSMLSGARTEQAWGDLLQLAGCAPHIR